MTQEYTGRSPYFADLDEGSSLLLVAVACFAEDLPQRTYALLDTGCPWCILPPPVASRLGLDLTNGEEATSLSTRFGTLVGRLERVSLTFDASEGHPLTLQATCFLSADWPGPMVVGWKGCLERIHFGFDTRLELFYFAGDPEEGAPTSLIIELTPEMERQLRDEAAREGQDTAAFARAILEERLATARRERARCVAALLDG